MDCSVKKIIEKIEKAGFEVYFVGGCLRDSILGVPPKDYDLATAAVPERIITLFDGEPGFKTVATGLKHGTVTVLYSGFAAEITTFRHDGEYADLRRPDKVTFTKSITEDLARRDFTINAMAYSEKTGLIDPFGGRDDLLSGIIRAVGDAKNRFGEDALRILRAFRFASQLGFEIEANTLEGAAVSRSGLEKIARERIGVEFSKLIIGKMPSSAIGLMCQNDILRFVLGDFAPPVNILCKIENLENNFSTRFGALLNGISENKAKEILLSLKYSNAVVSQTLSVSNGINFLAKNAIETDLNARNFIKKYKMNAVNIAKAAVALGFADTDITGIIARNAFSPWDTSALTVTGNDLLNIGISGKTLGKTLEYLSEAVIKNPAFNNRETLLLLAEEYFTRKINIQ